MSCAMSQEKSNVSFWKIGLTSFLIFWPLVTLLMIGYNESSSEDVYELTTKEYLLVQIPSLVGGLILGLKGKKRQISLNVAAIETRVSEKHRRNIETT